ncbi:MAG: M81 family metallopeptidase [Thermomicrobiales bacterium]
MPHLADRPLHLVLGGISHEMNTFSPMPTAMSDFLRRTSLTGEALLSSARGSDSALGGAIDSAPRNHVLPALFALATPAGPVTSETFAALTYEHVMGPIVPLDVFSNPSSPPAETVSPSSRLSRMAACPAFTEVTPRAW